MADDKLLDARFGQAAAETDTKIARIEGKIETAVATLGGKIDAYGVKMDALSEKITADHEYNRATRWVMIGLLITCSFAVAGLIVTMALYGDALFGRGMNVRDVVESVVKEQQQIQERQQ
jgi:hypothetical protein